MADNVKYADPVAGNVDFATDQIGTVHYQFVKLAFGALDTATIVTASAGLPVAQVGTWTVTGAGGSFPVTDSGSSLTVDAPVATPVFVRLSDGTSAIATLPVSLAALPALAAGTNAIGTVSLNTGTGRTAINLYATNAAAGATGVETAVTLTKSAGTGATTSAASFVVTSGKKFRIVSIIFAARGHATATIQATTFSLRMNTGGAVTTSSTPVLVQARVATPATASAWDRLSAQIPDGLEITGDGTLQIGITANAVFVTNAPTWDVWISGFEY